MKRFNALLATCALMMAPALLHAQAAAPVAGQASPTAVQSAPRAANDAATPVAAPSAEVVRPTFQAPAAAPVVGQASANAPTVTTAPPQQLPTPGVGMPDGRLGLQDQVTEVGQDAAWMHDVVLMPTITVISLFVLGLLIWATLRFRRSANPTPSRTAHNTWLEVFWTLAPVLILLLIAVPSIRLLAKQYAPPPADLTVKVIGNQWYWTYQYPDNGDFELVSNMLKEPADVTAGQRARKDSDGPRLLAVDERMVVPAGKVIKVITTSADVIHSFAVPAFWTKMDAVPGRLNETWFKVDRPGVYYGQCSELCGDRHAYMPIAVEVVPPAQFAAWVASKGGKMPGAKPAANPDATEANPIAPAKAATPAVDSDATVNATTTAQPIAQGATANQGSQAR